jgi:hypothetical protein
MKFALAIDRFAPEGFSLVRHGDGKDNPHIQ